MLLEDKPFIEASAPEPISFAPGLKTMAQVISYIFHPLFLPLVVTYLCVTAMPEQFVYFKEISRVFSFDILYIRVFANTLLFPLLVVVLGRALGFVSSIYLKSQQDRIIPYVASIIFYFWTFYTFKREGETPPFMNAFFLGIFIAVILSLVANNFVKISMHTVGWGGMIGFFIMLMFGMDMNVALPLAIIFVISGLVATARMILNAHTTGEIYIGFIVGIISQMLGYWFVG